MIDEDMLREQIEDLVSRIVELDNKIDSLKKEMIKDRRKRKELKKDLLEKQRLFWENGG